MGAFIFYTVLTVAVFGIVAGIADLIEKFAW